MNRGGTSNLAAEARAANDTMSYLSNNQQFLNGVLAYSRADVNTGSGQALLEAMRNAAATQAARETGTGGHDLIYSTPGVGSGIATGPLSGSNGSNFRWGTTTCDY
jgi:hypothetical protein